jgi:hypothetical protein
MKLLEVIKKYDAWVRYTPASLRADFDEYKDKELRKWRSRASLIGARWPLFTEVGELKAALDAAPIVSVDSLGDVGNLTVNSSIADIKDMVSTYSLPRDVNRIVVGLSTGDPLPLPIILKGRRGTWIMAGNTRQAVARVLKVPPKALLVDVRGRTK